MVDLEPYRLGIVYSISTTCCSDSMADILWLAAVAVWCISLLEEKDSTRLGVHRQQQFQGVSLICFPASHFFMIAAKMYVLLPCIYCSTE